MGDADETYGFGEVPRFVEALDDGADLVLGSRLKGRVHAGAMPWLHRWIGNPIITGMINLMFHARVSDAYAACGLSGAVHSRCSTCARPEWSSRWKWCSRRRRTGW